MKAYTLTFTLVALFSSFMMQAQRYGQNNTATVVAQNYDISDNLDLQAVASIFGDSRDLEDFERRLNDPSAQISNLDLNRDNYVDYLRVIEVADDDARIIVIQAVLGQDLFQDVATIELERERHSNTNVTVQIVGNPYLYGANYIYEPYYYRRPIFFDYFWASTYRPYYSPWYWGYYPTYYSYWSPMPIYRYRRHITPVINNRNRYIYADNRRISRADRIYSGVSRRGYEQSNPNRSFTQRNENATNRFVLDNNRSNGSTRLNQNGFRENNGRVSQNGVRDNGSRLNSSSVRNASDNGNRGNLRNNGQEVRTNTNFRGASEQRVSVPQNNRIERSSRVNTSNSNNINRSTTRQDNGSSRSSSSMRSSSSSPSMRSSSPAPSMRSSAPSSSMSRGGGAMSTSGGSRGGGSQRGGR